MAYLSLDPDRIVATVEALERRITERFPGAGLGRVASELVGVARQAAARSIEIQRPNRGLQAGVVGLALLFVVVVAILATRYLRIEHEAPTMSEIIQDVGALLESAFLIGASVVFLITFDTRLKRRRILAALYELRSLAHIVDMHQLTKDPEFLMSDATRTASSPARISDRFQLARYLDYSSEMLALIAKVAAIYVQGFHDPVALGEVDQVENLTNGLSRKVWQKIMLLDRVGR